MSRNERTPFRHELSIDAPPAEVWRALSEPAGIQGWFAPEARVEPGEGGTMEWRWGAEHVWPMRIESWEPGRRLRLAYDSAVADGRGGKVPLVMDFHLEGRGGTTLLRLVHSGFGPESDFDQEYDGISRGWPVELESLKLFLEHHGGRARRVAWRTASIEGAHRDAWRKLCGPDGLACGEEVDGLAPGSSFAFTASDGERFEGRVIASAPQELVGRATSHGDGFLRFSIESCGGVDQAWLWLASWREDGGAIERLEASWEAMLERLFASEPQGSARA